MYDVIVLGATFAAAGIAAALQEKCLVIEPRTQAGYEFFGALSFGTNCQKAPVRQAARDLQKALLPENGCPYGGDRLIYPYFEASHILFATRPVSTEQTEDGFLCTVHGVNGFCTYKAKTVVDTRSSDAISISKTYNLLIESEEPPALEGADIQPGGLDRHYLLSCPVPLSATFCDARSLAQKYIARFSETQKLILSANVFDYRVKPEFPKQSDGIHYLPSKLYEVPALAFEAGLAFAEEVQR